MTRHSSHFVWKKLASSLAGWESTAMLFPSGEHASEENARFGSAHSGRGFQPGARATTRRLLVVARRSPPAVSTSVDPHHVR